MIRHFETQEKLLVTLKKYSDAIIQVVPRCLVIIDKNGCIIGINEKVMRFTGFNAKELENMDIKRLIFPPITFTSNPYSKDKSAGAARPSQFEGNSETSSANSNSNSRQQVETNSSQCSLALGTFERQIRQKDGTLFPASVTVCNSPDRNIPNDQWKTCWATLPHWKLRNSTAEFGPTREETCSRISGGSQFTQVVLFHDITQQVLATEAISRAEKQATEAKETQGALLTYLVNVIYPTVERINSVINQMKALIQHKESTQKQGIAVQENCGNSKAGQDLRVNKTGSSRTNAENSGKLTALQDCQTCIDHVHRFLDDVATYVGMSPTWDGSTCVFESISIEQLLFGELEKLKDSVDIKRLQVDLRVQPADIVLRGNYLWLQKLVAKMLFIGSSVALTDASWTLVCKLKRQQQSTNINTSHCYRCHAPRKIGGSSDSVQSDKNEPHFATGPSATNMEQIDSTSNDLKNTHRPSASFSCSHCGSDTPIADSSGFCILAIRQELSLMDKSVILDDIELSLAHGSRGSNFGNLAITFASLFRQVKRHGGTVDRYSDVAKGNCVIDMNVLLGDLISGRA
jgi:PAS domain-containing protein